MLENYDQAFSIIINSLAIFASLLFIVGIGLLYLKSSHKEQSKAHKHQKVRHAHQHAHV
jgi:hypothetical protein